MDECHYRIPFDFVSVLDETRGYASVCSELDSIDGIGPKRKQELLKAFKSLGAIRSASLEELERYLPVSAAASALGCSTFCSGFFSGWGAASFG